MDGTFTVEQLTAVATFVISLCAVILILATIATARREVLGARGPWLMLAASAWILSFRVLGHFNEDAPFQTLRRLLGIVAAVLLPISLYLVLRRPTGERA